MRNRFIAISIISMITIIAGGSFLHGSVPRDLIQKQKSFVRELYLKERYFDCIAEARRTQCIISKTNNWHEYAYFIEGCYYLGKQYKSVISHIGLDDESDDLRLPFLIMLSQSYLNIGLSSKGMDVLRQIDYVEIGEDERYELLLRRCEILFRKSEYENAIFEIGIARNDIIGREDDIVKMKEDIEMYREIGERSKWLSVTLSSIFPGGGQVYSGRLMDGMISFISVLASAVGAYQFHKRGEDSLSITFGFLSLLLYAGNIYGAYNSAERMNMQRDSCFKLKLTKKYISPYNPMNYINIDSILGISDK
ncbi:MAG: hypothetical protein SVZ03_03125 [Spirochaetota bacterium]|nr:hypothetical protein [Spirochaetota bacterium]